MVGRGRRMVAEGRGRTTSCPIERNGRGVASPLPWRSPSGERTRRSRAPPHCIPCQPASWSTNQLMLHPFQVSGAGHRGIGHSGVGISAIGFGIPAPELQAPLPLPSQSGQLANYSTNQLMLHSQVPGLGHRVSGTGVQVRVQVSGMNGVGMR